ncbi:MAG: SDR family NAD(P)-dependent oxidoreductase [Candidatus Rokubacteria bacterium]|nr:SDR family NAD(P)-dependent oxidoreductase [Candidatus Rokubacteria bacterium]
MSPIELRGAVTILTGASRGIGPHIARALAREGAHLALSARDAEALERVAAEIRGLGARAVALPADVGRATDRARLVREAERALGPVDLLVNNAAIENEGPFTRLDTAAITTTIATNLDAPIQLTRLVLDGMLGRRRGHVVNVASLAGKKGVPYAAVYAGTKAGLIEWSGALRLELRGTGVSLSSICPGFVTGEGMFARSGLAPSPMIGSCTPQEVAAAVVRAVRRDEPEVFVNSRPMRPLLVVAAVAPRIAERLMRAIGLVDLQRRRTGV